MEPQTKRDEIVREIRELRVQERSTIEGWFRLGDLVIELRFRGGVPEATRWVANDLGMDYRDVVDAWFVAGAFPPATRREGVDWDMYSVLSHHPERHELVDLVARERWSEERLDQELERRAAAKWEQHAAG